MDKYIDNNNFVRLNQVQDNNDRLSFFKNKPFEYYDFVQRPMWVGKPYIGTRQTSRQHDNYATKKTEDFELYFGSYFFASEEMVS